MKSIILNNGMELIIDKAKNEDAKDMVEYLRLIGGESDNLLFGANEFPLTVEQEEEVIESRNKSLTSCFMLGRINGELVSVTSLTAPTRDRIAHTCEVAISVKKKFWNIGVGKNMLSELIEFAKNTNIITVIHLGVRADNENAIKLYEKLGFEKIGVYKNFFKINGNYYDEILMNLYNF